ncbi:MAG: 4Fe-4S binding protein, partial [Planctomycetia bacterium]|nr:4Fe-4S binding protein [Planctomycetia bacterium]
KTDEVWPREILDANPGYRGKTLFDVLYRNGKVDRFPLADMNADYGNDEARSFGRALTEKVARAMEGEQPEPPRYKFVGGKTFRLSLLCRRPILDWTMPKIEADRERCAKCDQCRKRCPTQNIRLDPWPTFLDECIFCYMCERVCPHHAIRCDWRKVARRMGV